MSHSFNIGLNTYFLPYRLLLSTLYVHHKLPYPYSYMSYSIIWDFLFYVHDFSIFISVTQLKCFFETMRTRFGKIATKKSGQGLQHLSHREKFIFNNFRFLKGHIRRSASRQSDTVGLYISLIHYCKMVANVVKR